MASFTAAKGLVDLRINVSKFSAQATKIQSRLDKLQGRFEKISRVGSRAFLVVGAAMSAAIFRGSAFEQSMQRVRVLTQATEVDFKKLEETASELGKTTVFSASQAAEAMGNLALSGFKVNEIIQALPSTLDLAAAGQIDLATAADITSKILRGMGIETGHTTGVIDVLAKAFTTANTDLVDLGEAFKFVAPIAASAGVSLEETAAALQILADSALGASLGGTGLRRILLTLQKATTERAFHDLGVEIREVTGEIRPLADIITDLNKELEGTDPRKQAKLLALFGDRAGPAMQILLSKGGDALKEYVKRLQDVGGTAKRIATEQVDTLRGDVTRLGSAFDNLSIVLTKSVNPALRSFTGAATGATNEVADIAKEFPKITATAAAGSLSILGLVASLGIMGQTIAFVAGGLGKLGVDMEKLSKGFARVKLTSKIFFPLGVAMGLATIAAGLLGRTINKLDKELQRLSDESKRFAEIGKQIGNLGEKIRKVQQEIAAAEGDGLKESKARLKIFGLELKLSEARLARTRALIRSELEQGKRATDSLLNQSSVLQDIIEIADLRVKVETAIAKKLSGQLDAARGFKEINEIALKLRKKGLGIDKELLEEAGTFAAQQQLINDRIDERLRKLGAEEKKLREQGNLTGRIAKILEENAKKILRLRGIQQDNLKKSGRDEVRAFLATKNELVIIEGNANRERLLSFAETEEERAAINKKINEQIKKRLAGPEKRAEFLDITEPFKRAQLAAANLGGGESVSVQEGRKQSGTLTKILTTLQQSNVLNAGQLAAVSKLIQGVRSGP